jgi:hypothetical protein
MDSNIIEMFRTLDYNLILNPDVYEWIKCILKIETSEERVKEFKEKTLKEKIEVYNSRELEDLKQELKEVELCIIPSPNGSYCITVGLQNEFTKVWKFHHYWVTGFGTKRIVEEDGIEEFMEKTPEKETEYYSKKLEDLKQKLKEDDL